MNCLFKTGSEIIKGVFNCSNVALSQLVRLKEFSVMFYVLNSFQMSHYSSPSKILEL